MVLVLYFYKLKSYRFGEVIFKSFLEVLRFIVKLLIWFKGYFLKLLVWIGEVNDLVEFCILFLEFIEFFF